MNLLTVFDGDDFIEVSLSKLKELQTDEVLDLYYSNESSRAVIRDEIKMGAVINAETQKLADGLKSSSLEIFKEICERLGENIALKIAAALDLTLKLIELDETN